VSSKQNFLRILNNLDVITPYPSSEGRGWDIRLFHYEKKRSSQRDQAPHKCLRTMMQAALPKPEGGRHHIDSSFWNVSDEQGQ
jgi:hypothetical protein